jgi:hypothetical protein
MTDTQKQITQVCDNIKSLLLEKNKNYGDSALNPVRTFSKASALEQLFVRIDDKLSRIARGKGLLGSDEDTIDDLIGYLVLTKIALQRSKEQWNGSDIEPVYRKTSVGLMDTSSLNDSEWLDLHLSGDKFA